MKIRKSVFCILLGLLVLTGCSSTSSIASFSDKNYFKESPSIITYQDKYFLRFVYTDESFAFFMMCDSKIKSDSLIYYLPVTTSSGNLIGKIQFQEIIKENEIEIIKKKKVFWEEPDESYVLMMIERIKDEEINLLPKTENKKK